MVPERDVWWDDVMKDTSDTCEPEWLNSEDPLFMLYTSGSTGKPKVQYTVVYILNKLYRANKI